MLKKFNWVVCGAAIVLAALEIVATLTGAAGMLLAAAMLPKAIMAGVCLSAVLWVVAQWKRDDGAARPAMLALVCFALCAIFWLIQLFWMMGVML
nr:hypothetical protein [uncultured Butyricicoccus sp.]